MYDLNLVGKSAKTASRELIKLSNEEKNRALNAIADELIKNTDIILQENKKDLDSLKLNANDFEIDVTGLTEGIHTVSVRFIKELDKSYEVIHVEDCDINVMKVSEGPSLDSTTEINEIVKNEGE